MSDKYRISLTAPQIERILLSVATKLSADDIVYDYTAGGEAGKVAAASAVKNMWLKLNEMVTGEGLKDAINAADDSNVFTDHYKSILDTESFKYVGSPADILARDDIVTANFTGGEVILVQKNEAGVPEFQFWKKSAGSDSYSWQPIYEEVKSTSIIVPTASTKLLKQIPINIFHMVEYRIHAYDNVNKHWQTFDGKIGYQGEDLYFTRYNEVQTQELLTVSYTLTATDMELRVTTKQPNTTVWLSFIAGY